MKKNPLLTISFILFLSIILCIGIYLLPPINQRIAWRMANLRTQIHYLLNPPDQIVLAPATQVESNITTILPTIIPTHTPEQTTIYPSNNTAVTPSPIVPTVTATAISLPPKANIINVPHEYQSFNNCGPANLSMVMRFWGWQGDQRIIRDTLRSNENDANVMPDELTGFVVNHSDLRAIYRIGGTLQQLKLFIASGFPVIVESGHDPSDDWWMGHYVTISGYDDEHATFITQDSLIMPDLPLAYSELENNGWRDFNNLYIVVYPQSRQEQVFSMLGDDLDPQVNVVNSLRKTSEQLPNLGGREYFFGLYNQGCDQLALGDSQKAASSFDQAFAFYQTLKEEIRPWRVLWYRVEPYQAYFQVNRYQAVIDLANATLSMLSKHGLEESHYWRGMAYQALGNKEKAKSDFEIALELRPDYALALAALRSLQ